MERLLLDIEEASTVLNKSVDWIYRHWPTLPFAFKLGKELRFSITGIEQYITTQLQEKQHGRPGLSPGQNLSHRI